MIKVVQCRDCKSWRRMLNGNEGTCRNTDMLDNVHYVEDSLIWIETDADFYCAYGERKEQE